MYQILSVTHIDRVIVHSVSVTAASEAELFLQLQGGFRASEVNLVGGDNRQRYDLVKQLQGFRSGTVRIYGHLLSLMFCWFLSFACKKLSKERTRSFAQDVQRLKRRLREAGWKECVN